MISTLLSVLPDTTVGLADDALLVRNAQNDLGAFAELYGLYADRVYRYLLVRTGGRDAAQDLTSQTFLAAMQGLHNYRPGKPFIAWLLGIARNKAVDNLRRTNPGAPLESAEEVMDEQESPEELVDRQMALERIAVKLQALAKDRAEALSLRLFAGLEVPQIAEIMNRNEAAVRMLVFRGLKDLRTHLEEEWEER